MDSVSKRAYDDLAVPKLSDNESKILWGRPSPWSWDGTLAEPREQHHAALT